jgi:hypothetical protein
MMYLKECKYLEQVFWTFFFFIFILILYVFLSNICYLFYSTLSSKHYHAVYIVHCLVHTLLNNWYHHEKNVFILWNVSFFSSTIFLHLFFSVIFQDYMYIPLVFYDFFVIVISTINMFVLLEKNLPFYFLTFGSILKLTMEHLNHVHMVQELLKLL